MYELNHHQTQCVSGSDWVYVTEQWKLVDNLCNGILGGLVGASLGVLLGDVTFGCLGGIAGFALSFSMNALYNSTLENNTWYYFDTPIYIYV